MGIKGIDHWVIVAGDLQRTLDFYQGLGFTIAWEKRPGRPDMATIRINDAQKINVHGPDAPARPGYLGAWQPTVGAPICPNGRDRPTGLALLSGTGGAELTRTPLVRAGAPTSVYSRPETTSSSHRVLSA